MPYGGVVAKVKRLRYLEPTAMGKATVASELKIVVKPNIKTAVEACEGYMRLRT